MNGNSKKLVDVGGTLIDPAAIPTEVIRAEYTRRCVDFRPSPVPTQEIEGAYRMIAEGRGAEAMELLARTFPRLAPPSHELKLADLLSHG